MLCLSICCVFTSDASHPHAGARQQRWLKCLWGLRGSFATTDISIFIHYHQSCFLCVFSREYQSNMCLFFHFKNSFHLFLKLYSSYNKWGNILIYFIHWYQCCVSFLQFLCVCMNLRGELHVVLSSLFFINPKVCSESDVTPSFVRIQQVINEAPVDTTRLKWRSEPRVQLLLIVSEWGFSGWFTVVSWCNCWWRLQSGQQFLL